MFSKRLVLASSLVIALLASMPVSAQQLAVPVGDDVSGNDVSKGAFKAISGNNLPLWPDVDEKLSLDDTDYIYSGKSASTAELFLSDPTDPNIGTGHIIRFKARRTGGSASVELQLLESGVLRATTGVRTPSVANTWEEIFYTLSEAEADAIGNYNNLTMSVTSSSVGNNNEIEITWMELEVPDAVTAAEPAVGSPTFADVTHTGATLGGTVTDLGTPASLNDCGIEWGTLADQNPVPSWPNRVGGGLPCAAVNDEFTVSVALPAETEIYFRAWANNGQDGFSLEGGPFTTPAAPSVPEVSTLAAIDIGQNSATLRGEVTADGGAAIDDRGIEWGTNQGGPYELGNQSVGPGPTGVFTVPASNLPAGRTIYFRAYATNSAGTTIAGELSFPTLNGPPTVDSATVTDITATTADLGGTMSSNGGEAPSACGIEWGTTAGGPYPNPETLTPGVCLEGDPFAVNDVPGLPTGTPVYFRAWATNSFGTGYSEQGGPFTPAGPPVVTATPASDIKLRSAILGGDVTSEGGSPVIERGIYWDTAQPPEAAGTKVVISFATGTGTFSKTISNLPSGTQIFWKAFASNAGDTGFSGQEQFTTLSEPTLQASNLTFPVLAGRSMQIRWIRGDGDGVVVVMRLVTESRSDPQDGTDYVADTNFGLAEEVSVNSNNFVVYKGPATSVVVTGLTFLTTYQVAVYEYANTPSGPNYKLTPVLEGPPEGVSTTDYTVHNYDFGIDCTRCHYHKKASGSAQTGFGARGDALSAVCETCHNPSGDASGKLEFANHTNPGRNPDIDLVDCGMCHELHNISGDLTGNTTLSTNTITPGTAQNKSFLRANVGKYVDPDYQLDREAWPKAFLHNDTPKREDPHPDAPQAADTPERAEEGGDATTSRGYCQVCHTMTAYHRNNPANGATTPSDYLKPGFMQCHDGGQVNAACEPEVHCGDCHQHNNSFAGVNANVPCEQCHDQTGQGTLPIITTQFDKLSKHIPGGSTDAVKANCVVCHDNYGHTGLYVLDADDDTQYSTGVPGHDTLATGVSETFAPHCLSCHDDGSADSLAADSGQPTTGQTQSSPFTNSDRPPVIDETLWASAGHNRPLATFPSTPVTCVGGGANGCHSSGHGSDELNLLAPIPTDADIDDDASVFCTECHKPGGTSSKDIRTAFRPDPNAATEALYQTTSGSGAAVNRRHDIFDADQAYSAGAVTCSACHSPHADNAGMATVLVPSDTQPRVEVGVLGYNSGDPPNPFIYGTGHDPINPVGIIPSQNLTEPDYIEFCLVCHGSDAGTSPLPGVTMSTSLINIATANAGDQHGAGTGGNSQNGYLKYPWNEAGVTDDSNPAYAALNCTTCHGAHGTGNIFNLRESITVAGVQMTVGGWVGDTIGEDPNNPGSPRVGQTTYTLPLVGRQTQKQEDHQWGAWCSFCHQMQQHSRDEDVRCTNGHMHGSTNAF